MAQVTKMEVSMDRELSELELECIVAGSEGSAGDETIEPATPSGNVTGSF